MKKLYILIQCPFCGNNISTKPKELEAESTELVECSVKQRGCGRHFVIKKILDYSVKIYNLEFLNEKKEV